MPYVYPGVRELVIRPDHCYASELGWCDRLHCPVAEAIREQYPDFRLRSVGGSFIRDMDRVDYYFDFMEWNSGIMQKLITGKIAQVTIKF